MKQHSLKKIIMHITKVWLRQSPFQQVITTVLPVITNLMLIWLGEGLRSANALANGCYFSICCIIESTTTATTATTTTTTPSTTTREISVYYISSRSLSLILCRLNYQVARHSRGVLYFTAFLHLFDTQTVTVIIIIIIIILYYYNWHTAVEHKVVSKT